MLACDAVPMHAKFQSFYCHAGLPPLSPLPFPVLISMLLLFPLPPACSTQIIGALQTANSLLLYVICHIILLKRLPEEARSRLTR
jgi:hypothetical protein